MKKFAFAALATSALILSACGGSSPHAVCKDEKTTTEYTQKILMDVGMKAPEKIDALSKEVIDMATASGNDFGGFCTKLDEWKKKNGG
jgi:hypothetical protein